MEPCLLATGDKGQDYSQQMCVTGRCGQSRTRTEVGGGISRAPGNKGIRPTQSREGPPSRGTVPAAPPPRAGGRAWGPRERSQCPAYSQRAPGTVPTGRAGGPPCLSQGPSGRYNSTGRNEAPTSRPAARDTRRPRQEAAEKAPVRPDSAFCLSWDRALWGCDPRHSRP